MQKQYRNKALDGLRGLAALSVALGHCDTKLTGVEVWSKSIVDFPNMPFTQILGRLGHVIFPADAAIVVFFVLSGYVLWGSIIRREKNTMIDVVPYMVSRMYRLLPVAIISALILAFILPASGLDVARNALLLSYNMNGVLWTLQIEMLGSLLIFIGFLMVHKHLLFILPLMLSVYLCDHISPFFTFYFIPFFLGVTLQYLPARLFQKTTLAVAAYCIMIFADLLLQRGHLTDIVRFISAGLFVGVVVHKQFKFLNAKIPQFLGDISYSFYLTHLVGILATDKIIDYFGLYPTNQFYMFVLLAFFSVGATLPISWLIHIFIEKPGIAAGAEVVKKIQGLPDRMSRLLIQVISEKINKAKSMAPPTSII